VGAGPGDPLLMTLKGRQCIEKADVVVYDYLSNPVFLEWTPEGARGSTPAKPQGTTRCSRPKSRSSCRENPGGKNRRASQGRGPVSLREGWRGSCGPCGRGLRLRSSPGISSALAAPSYAGIPVTHRAHNTMLTIFTGHQDPAKTESSIDFQTLAKTPGTKVMVMGIERLAQVTAGLLDAGMDAETPAALVRWASTPRQQTLTGKLSDIARKAEQAAFKAPAVAVFGGVVGLRDKLNWFESLPLFGKRIAVTRTQSQAGELVAQLRALGADAFEMPMIRIEPAPDKREFYETVAYSHGYD